MLIPDLLNVLLVTQDCDLTFVILQSERFLLVKALNFYKLLPAVIDTTTQRTENIIIFNILINSGVIRKIVLVSISDEYCYSLEDISFKL